MEQQKEPEKKATNFWDEPWEPDMSWKCGTPMLQDLKKKREKKASEGTESSGRETGQEPEVIRFRDTTDKEQSDGTREAYEEAINTKGR